MLQIWMNGEFVPEDQATVSVFDHGLLYGDGCFEGIRVYNGRIFKLDSHLKRLFRSAEKLRITIPYTLEEMAHALREGVRVNNVVNGYIRPVVTRGYGNLGLNPFQCERPCVIVITATIQLYPPALYETGMKVVVANRPRVDKKALDPAVKSLNYLNNIMAKVESIDAGVLEAIMLNNEGYVAECTGDNIFGIKDGKVFTPPVDAGILEGITRNFVIELCRDLDIPCEEKLFTIDELVQADEIFLTGTAAEIMSVTHVDEQQIGSGTPGEVTNRLLAEFRRRTGTDAPED
ncbi:MAG: branched-chain-amino-acid transaminase [Planctomycetes bacterium]|nr:branched-chain-amino-acid transaminase [Planctomycetota bacterium]NOG53568.1 branched-chain-amino-acid transaminase [Planctomycetota bacterium]